jgi:[acyl-carrier-protein] S-malonyltransferase
MTSQKTAFLFPGQGSQYLGMGRDLFDHSPEVRHIFEQVDEICQMPISKLCFDGPLEELTLTVHLQPAITAVNLACLATLMKGGISPDFSAGHSLGEYAALASGGILTTESALRLVKKRGELMHRESVNKPGAMAAILGLDIGIVQALVEEAAQEDIVAVANHNTAEQIVITGQKEALSRALELAQGKGGKAIPLKVSGAWHCRLMERGVDEFRQFMEDIPFSAPESTVLFNATAQTETWPEKMKDIMAQQLVSPVRWYDIIRKMMESGVDTFVEVGPKKVLTGLLKKIIPKDYDAKIYQVEDRQSIERFLEDKD